MSPKPVGYCSPPEYARFKKGVSGNPKGRPRRGPETLAKAIRDSMEEETTYREGRYIRRKPRWYVLLKKYVQGACAGNLVDAEAIIRLRNQYRREATAVPVITVEDLLPADPPKVADSTGPSPANDAPSGTRGQE